MVQWWLVGKCIDAAVPSEEMLIVVMATGEVHGYSGSQYRISSSCGI